MKFVRGKGPKKVLDVGLREVIRSEAEKRWGKPKSGEYKSGEFSPENEEDYRLLCFSVLSFNLDWIDFLLRENSLGEDVVMVTVGQIIWSHPDYIKKYGQQSTGNKEVYKGKEEVAKRDGEELIKVLRHVLDSNKDYRPVPPQWEEAKDTPIMDVLHEYFGEYPKKKP